MQYDSVYGDFLYIWCQFFLYCYDLKMRKKGRRATKTIWKIGAGSALVAGSVYAARKASNKINLRQKLNATKYSLGIHLGIYKSYCNVAFSHELITAGTSLVTPHTATPKQQNVAICYSLPQGINTFPTAKNMPIELYNEYCGSGLLPHPSGDVLLNFMNLVTQLLLKVMKDAYEEQHSRACKFARFLFDLDKENFRTVMMEFSLEDGINADLKLLLWAGNRIDISVSLEKTQPASGMSNFEWQKPDFKTFLVTLKPDLTSKDSEKECRNIFNEYMYGPKQFEQPTISLQGDGCGDVNHSCKNMEGKDIIFGSIKMKVASDSIRPIVSDQIVAIESLTSNTF